MSNSSLTYITKYNLGDEETMIPIMGLYFAPVIIGMVGIPLLSKLFSLFLHTDEEKI